MKIVLNRVNNAVHFEAINETNNRVQMDGSPSIGGENLGARPMEMVLVGLAGCSAIDVVSILNKQKQELIDMSIEVDGERTEEIPNVFTHIMVKYIVEGNIDKDKMIRAVSLSSEKYCSVAAMLKKGAHISYSIELNGNQIQ